MLRPRWPLALLAAVLLAPAAFAQEAAQLAAEPAYQALPWRTVAATPYPAFEKKHGAGRLRSDIHALALFWAECKAKENDARAKAASPATLAQVKRTRTLLEKWDLVKLSPKVGYDGGTLELNRHSAREAVNREVALALLLTRLTGKPGGPAVTAARAKFSKWVAAQGKGPLPPAEAELERIEPGGVHYTREEFDQWYADLRREAVAFEKGALALPAPAARALFLYAVRDDYAPSLTERDLRQ